MAQTGKYEEQLPSGGTLRVLRDSWAISFYFPGPDRRYNGTFYEIEGSKVPDLIEAYRSAFARYCEVKASIPQNGSYTVLVDMRLTIRIGSHPEGVCLNHLHFPVADEAALDRRVQSFRHAIHRATKVQQMLRDMSVSVG